MARTSLAGKPLRTGNVDEDLAQSNMTRQDLSVGEYRFSRVWKHFRREGWRAAKGRPLDYDHFYIKPGKDLERGVEGVDYFYGEAALCRYAVDIKLFGDDGREEPSVAVGENGGSSSTMNQSAMNGASDSAGVKTEVKQENGGSTTMRRQATVPARRQWPATHPSKGRHADDAICIDLDDNDTDEAARPTIRGKGKRKVAPIVETDEGDEDEDQDNGVDRDPDDESVGTAASDATAHSEASTETSKKSKRPLLKTRTKKKQKLYAPKVMVAAKSKSPPRGMLFERVRIYEEESPPRPPKKAKKTPPASPTRAADRHVNHIHTHSQATEKAKAAHGLGSDFDATVKEEVPLSASPVVETNGSSVTSSHDTTPAPGKSSTIEALLEVVDAVFPARPNEKYHVIITKVVETDETTIRMEERTSHQQWIFTFSDIRELCDDPATKLPAMPLYQALYTSLIAISSSITVAPPKVLESQQDSDGGSQDTEIIFERDESAGDCVVLIYPKTGIFQWRHLFPMARVAESYRVESLLSELSNAREELRIVQTALNSSRHELEVLKDQHKRELAEARQQLRISELKLQGTLRDLEAFKRQHNQLEQEYQKTRKALESQRQPEPAATPPTAAPRPPTPQSSRGNVAPTQASASPQQKRHTKLQKFQDSMASRRPLKQLRTIAAPRCYPPSPPPVAPPSTAVTAQAKTTTPTTGSSYLCFHAQDGWMSTMFTFASRLPRTDSDDPFGIPWKKIIETNEGRCSVRAADAQPTMVTLRARGSYRVTVTINHKPYVQPAIVVTSREGAKSHELIYRSLLQIAEAADGQRFTSFLDATVECVEHDAIMIQLRYSGDNETIADKLERMDKYTPPQNDWQIRLNDPTTPSTNGTQSNGAK